MQDLSSPPTDGALTSSAVADWSREKPASFWDPGKKLLRSIRTYQACADKRGPLCALLRAVCVVRHRFWAVVTGADIPLNAKIGGGLLIPHPNGIVIHPEAIIGVNCLLFQQVTIGTRGGVEAPRLGGHVDVGAGAKILGAVTIGRHAAIGANSVVLHDVPDGAAVAGIPSRVVSVRAVPPP